MNVEDHTEVRQNSVRSTGVISLGLDIPCLWSNQGKITRIEKFKPNNKFNLHVH